MTGIKGPNVISNFIWKFLERILAQLITFVVSVILARILAPEAYGIIAIVLAFIEIANIFVTAGFGEALIVKKNADDIDFSTIFWCSFVFAWIIYLLIFFASPLIASIYENPILIPIFRVLALKLPLASFNTVQNAIIAINMQFKKYFFSILFGAVISGIIGIRMAYSGFGVWALVFQYLVNSSISTVVLLLTIQWKPKLCFSFNRAKRLMDFGWKMMFSNLINTVYVELQGLIIGAYYTTADLAQYKRGNQFPSLFINNINSAITSVLFPTMSKANMDVRQVKVIARKSLSLSAFIIFPIMTGLALVAKPLVVLLLTEKWIDCVPFLQISCACFVLQPLQTTNAQAIKAMGRSDVYLRMEIIKKIVGVVLLMISIPFGVIAIAFSLLLSVIFSTIVTCFPNRRIIAYSFKEQFLDIIQPTILCVIMAICVIPISFMNIPNYLMLLIQIGTGSFVYLGASIIIKNPSIAYLIALVRSIIDKKH